MYYLFIPSSYELSPALTCARNIIKVIGYFTVFGARSSVPVLYPCHYNTDVCNASFEIIYIQVRTLDCDCTFGCLNIYMFIITMMTTNLNFFFSRLDLLSIMIDIINVLTIYKLLLDRIHPYQVLYDRTKKTLRDKNLSRYL